MRVLRAPFDAAEARSLELGETVYLSGRIVTGRDEMHLRALRLSDRGEEVPECIRGSVLYHCGPIMARGADGWRAVAAGPTTSARMNGPGPEMIRRFGLRAIIGKGGMSREACDAMGGAGCVYLAAVGGTAVSLAASIQRVCGVEWADLGMAEAAWILDVDRMGPLTVAVDSSGDSLYEKVASSVKRLI
ncbi:MAG: FumA C-terminus/TtdB family hydratase beta subunit [Candidatus Methanoplasma sp.]|nr:FumA C-terminus/TtdB family hydratase beta subunit [Candidatus Methanoplasma sp.]